MKTLKKNLAVFLCIVILGTIPMVTTSCADSGFNWPAALGAVAGVYLAWAIRDGLANNDYVSGFDAVGPIASDQSIVSLFNETSEPWEFYLDGKFMGTIEPGGPVDFLLKEGNHDAYLTTNSVTYQSIYKTAFFVPKQDCSAVLRPIESAAR